MRFLSSPGQACGRARPHAWQTLPLLISLIPSTQGINYTPVSFPDLDLSQLGRVALTGNFDAISLYSYEHQTEDAFSTNGTQSLISQLPNGDFANTANADGYIKTLCPFVTNDGKLQGIVVGGNFTSLGGVAAQGVALYDPSTSNVTPLTGLTGSVNALYCDQPTDTVYVGGQFKGANSTNSIIWVGQQGWVNLPFEGFNGPVNSIVKGPNGTVIFGGSFTGLGNKTAPAKSDSQVINISSANLTSAETTDTAGFNEESNIVCKTDGASGSGSTWLLKDNTPGWWRADMNFGYEPSLLRIYNTHYQGRGTQEFRFTAIPINGIMNFTYTDPKTGQEGLVCDARCPLTDDPSVPYQDFRFVNTVGMSAFRIDISAWYGAGGGLNGIELFQNDTFAYAENDLNEPSCAKTSFPSRSTQTGPWNVMPSALSVSRYLAADVTGNEASPQDVSVTFQPDIKQQGNYSVTIFTPGCIQDNSCDRRGIVNVTGSFSTSTGASQPIASQIYQTNNYDKYDEIYRGPVDISGGGFRPSVTVSPLSSQKDPVMIVAQRVQFSILGNGTSILNGLYEFDPKATDVSADFSNSTVDVAGANLDTGAVINKIVMQDNMMYVAGNFSDDSAGFRNIFAMGNGNASALANGGLNDQISDLLVYQDTLYMAGNFTDTVNGSVPGLSNVAAYVPANQQWQALGAGVDGPVDTVVGFTLNITTDTPELCIAVNGHFGQIKASGSDKAAAVDGFAVWVPSRKNWLRNLGLSSQAVTGKLSAMTNITGNAPLLAGSLSAQDLSASDIVSLRQKPVRLDAFDIGIQPPTVGPQTRKRATNSQNVQGIVTGLFFNENNINATILGGHFTGTASDGSTIENLAIVQSKDNNLQTIGLGSGIDPDSTFLALDTSGSDLYAGGSITGKVNDAEINGLVVYDLGGQKLASPQPPALKGNKVVVNAVTVPPKKEQVFVGGDFESAGSLSCPSVCIFDNGAWTQPGSGIAGVVSAFSWQGNDQLLVGGNLTISNNATSLASYNLQSSEWTVLDGASEAIPGAVTALTQAEGGDMHFWSAGQASNNSAFLVKYDGSKFHSPGSIFGPETVIQGLSLLNTGKSHSNNDLIPGSLILMILGELNIPNFGNASAALFNGTTLMPYALTTSGNGPGRLAQLFSEQETTFTNPGGHMALGFVVLIALACALGAVFLLVVAGILIERYRRKKEGYTPAPTAYFDKTSNMGRIPPEHLFGRLGEGRQAPTL